MLVMGQAMCKGRIAKIIQELKSQSFILRKHKKSQPRQREKKKTTLGCIVARLHTTKEKDDLSSH